MPHLPAKMAAAHSNSAARRLCVLFLLLSGATLSAATYTTQDSPLCPMPSPAPQNQPAGKDAHLELLSSLELSAGYFYGGEDIHFTKDDSNETSSHVVSRSFSLLPVNVDSTTDPTLFHVTATLVLSGGRARHFYAGAHRRRRHDYVGDHSVTFHFQGYYSTTPGSAELCMAGSGYYTEEDGSAQRLRDVGLHLLVPNPPSISRPFVTGRLKGAGFETISLVAYAEGDVYRYGESASSCSPPPSTARGAPQALGANFSCAHLKEHLETSYKLQYGGGAHASSSWPLTGLQALRMHVGQVQCTPDGAVRAYAAFSDDTTTDDARRRWRLQRPPFMLNDEVVVAEGRWNATEGVLCLKACRVPRSSSGTSPSAGEPECGIGMSFWLPGVWTIRDRSAVAGMLWNSTQVAAPGNGVSGGVVSASSIDFNSHRSNFSDVKYSYNDTMIEEAKKYYQDILNKQRKVKGSSFLVPNYTYHDFELRFFEDRGFGFAGDGHAYPVSIGSTTVYGDRLVADDSFSRARDAMVDVKPEELLNVSYDIRESVPPAGWVPPKKRSYSIPIQARQMRAEGVFDPRTGILCLIACREYNDSTTDCQILITVRFASLDGKAQQLEGHGRGVISSLRNKTTNDPFFFEKTDIRLFGMYSEQVSEEISRMDVESILLVISTTLPCVFTALQILHVRRKPEAAAATSITMLVVLALGYVAPLVVSSEALFMGRRQGFVPLLPFQSYVPYELSQAMMRAPTLIALLLQLRLIQLAWSARKKTATDAADRSKDAEASSSSPAASAESERRALWVCVPLYLIGGALTVVVHVVNARRAAREDSLTVRVGPEPATLLEDLVSSGGLALDSFLLPQVAMNALSPGPGPGAAMVVRALSPWFYIGGTVVRAMPHVYDVIRAQGYAPSLKPSYVYASPRYDRFGIAWDVVVPCGAALLAVLLFLQQQQRVRLAAPLFRSRKRLGEYEMVSPESPL